MRNGNIVFRLIGLTNTELTCDCCGRTDLKETVKLWSEETGFVHYGTSCAGKAMKWQGSRSKIAKMIEERLSTDPKMIAVTRTEDAFETAMAALEAGIDRAQSKAEIGALNKPAYDALQGTWRNWKAYNKAKDRWDAAMVRFVDRVDEMGWLETTKHR